MSRQEDIMAELADRTGGTYVCNANDLPRGTQGPEFATQFRTYWGFTLRI
jgi:hypothetical protein